MDALKKWLEVRGDDDCPYMFVVKTKDGSKVRQIGYSAFNDWCINEFSEIVGRRTTPHTSEEAERPILYVMTIVHGNSTETFGARIF